MGKNRSRTQEPKALRPPQEAQKNTTGLSKEIDNLKEQLQKNKENLRSDMAAVKRELDEYKKTSEVELGNIKQKLEKSDDGLPRWIKKWGAILGLFAVIVALPHAIIDLYNDLYSKPNIEIPSVTSLNVEYDSTLKTIQFSFDLTIQNKGGEAEIITNVSGRITNPNLPIDRFVPFANPEFLFSEGEDSHSPPLTIEKEEIKRTKCTISKKIGQVSRSIIEYPGKLHFSIYLNGKKDQTYDIDMCFQIEPEFFQTSDKQAIIFDSVSCP